MCGASERRLPASNGGDSDDINREKLSEKGNNAFQTLKHRTNEGKIGRSELSSFYKGSRSETDRQAFV